jgi:hypothetical protein
LVYFRDKKVVSDNIAFFRAPLHREHFRCAQSFPIVTRSSDGSLTPLRLPTSNERLQNCLLLMYASNGRKVGKVNEREQEIVNRIQAYTSSCSTSNWTIGIISLVGDEQSRLIAVGAFDYWTEKYKEAWYSGGRPQLSKELSVISFLSLVVLQGCSNSSQLMHTLSEQM